MLSQSEPSPAKIHAGLNGVVRDTLLPAAAMLAIAHVCYAVARAIQLPADSRGVTILLDAVTVLIGGGLWLYFSKAQVPRSHGNRWAGLMLGLAWANFGSQVYFTPIPSLTIYLVLLIVAAGCLLLSWSWLATVILGSLGVWGLGILLNPEANWWGIVHIVLVGVILGILVHAIRWRTYAQYERVKLQLEQTTSRAEEEICNLNQQLEQASKLVGLGEMAANLAHDLGKGLSAILHYTQGAERRLERGTLTLEQCGECIQEIQRQAQYMRDILMMIQQFVRLRATERVPIQLPEVVKQAEMLVRGKLQQRSVALHFAEFPEIPPLSADHAQIILVTVNLLLNAAQAMANTDLEKRTITVALHHNSPDFVEVSIRDQGPGMSSDVKEKIFDKFYTTKKDGMGLGLAFSRSYIEQHGGKLWCESHSNAGCDFRYSLPLTDSALPHA